VRALGIDYGERRIGLALSDPTGTLATPLTTITYRLGKRPPLGDVERIAREAEAGRVVIGLPLDLSGNETDRCATVRALGAKLASRLGLPVHFVDERMTSVRASRTIRSSERNRSERERKDLVDAIAAAYILQAWLDGEAAR
jgi:putative Holliday junction resolvase